MNQSNNPDIVVYWPDSLKNQTPLSMESLIEYQNLKFNKIEGVLKGNYQKLNQVEKGQFPLFDSCATFYDSVMNNGFITAIIISIDQNENNVKLTLMDPSGIYELAYEKEEVDKCADLVLGLHLGFKVSKKEEFSKFKKSRPQQKKNSISSLLNQITKTTPLVLKDFIWPDLDVETPWANTGSSKVVIVSDIHCGSITFLTQNFSQLVHKINLDPTVKYVIMNGDLVDGRYIYPEHSSELNIKTYHEQYVALASTLSNLRPDITVIAAPGNHDMVRKVEPQFFSDQVKEIFTQHIKNIVFLSNPSYLRIEGVYFYLTHGTSYNSILSAVPRLDSRHCVDVSEYLCKSRNISPIRNAVPIRPNTQLYHIIPDKVNVICAGHMHNQGVKIYKGRLLITTGAWQHETPFMKLLGVHASIAQGVCLDLSNINNHVEYDLQDQTSDRHTYHRAIVEKMT